MNVTGRNAVRKQHVGAKVLLIDIESSPILGWSWKKWDTNILHVERDWQLLMVGYKWLHEKQANVLSGRFLTELELVDETRSLLDVADVVVAHNGDSFDIKKLQAKMAAFKMQPPSPFKTVDTLRVAKNHFAFTSNKLDDLGNTLSLGRKADTGGFQLWLDVMDDKPAAWKKMEAYCKQDVLLLEKLYNELRPWTPRHPNMAVLAGAEGIVCGCCGSEKLQSRGYYSTNSGMYQRFQCNDCGAWSRMRKKAGGGISRNSTIVCDRK
jgi:hypothetical protein